MDTAFLRQKFEAALTYDDYLKTGKEEQIKRWRDAESHTSVTSDQATMIGAFTRQMNVLCISGIWCGDCVAQGPMLEVIARANHGKIALRFVDRDQQKDLADLFRINGGHRVPTTLFLSEDCEFCALIGDRTLARYRAIAARKLGPACPIGIGAPDKDELAATVQDWVNEFERVQLMLRLSPRLREKYGD